MTDSQKRLINLGMVSRTIPVSIPNKAGASSLENNRLNI